MQKQGHSTMTVAMVGLGGMALGALLKTQYDKMQAAAAAARLQQPAAQNPAPAPAGYAPAYG